MGLQSMFNGYMDWIRLMDKWAMRLFRFDGILVWTRGLNNGLKDLIY